MKYLCNELYLEYIDIGFIYLDEGRNPDILGNHAHYAVTGQCSRIMGLVDPKGSIKPLLLHPGIRKSGTDLTVDFARNIGVKGSENEFEYIFDSSEKCILPNGKIDFERAKATLIERYSDTSRLIVNDTWSAENGSFYKNVFHRSVLDAKYHADKRNIQELIASELRSEQFIYIEKLNIIQIDEIGNNKVSINRVIFDFPLRIKSVDGASGKGQKTIQNYVDLCAFIKDNGDSYLYEKGCIIEPAFDPENFEELAFQNLIGKNKSLTGPVLGQIADNYGDWCGSYFSNDYGKVFKTDSNRILQIQEKSFKQTQESGLLGIVSEDAIVVGYNGNIDHRLGNLQASIGDRNPRLGGGSGLVDHWMNLDVNDTDIHIVGSIQIRGDLLRIRETISELLKKGNGSLYSFGLSEIEVTGEETLLVTNVIISGRDLQDISELNKEFGIQIPILGQVQKKLNNL